MKRPNRIVFALLSLSLMTAAMVFLEAVPAYSQTCSTGASAPCAEDPALDACMQCHGYQLVGGNRNGTDRYIFFSSGPLRHQIAPLRDDWTSTVQAMVNKGARAVLELTAGYLNTNYCSTCTGPIVGSPAVSNITETSASVTWSTSYNGFEDEPADTVLFYGQNAADVLLGPACATCQNVSGPALTAHHVVDLSGLACGKAHSVLNRATSSHGTVTGTYTVNFRTKKCPGG
ncbi:MAG TPA: hypothetical protein VI702_05395, partial [Nitrospiria bacterium]